MDYEPIKYFYFTLAFVFAFIFLIPLAFPLFAGGYYLNKGKFTIAFATMGVGAALAMVFYRLV
jgi:hypothetical protein